MLKSRDGRFRREVMKPGWDGGQLKELGLFPIFEWRKVGKVGKVQLCWDECADSHDVGETRHQGGRGFTAQDLGE